MARPKKLSDAELAEGLKALPAWRVEGGQLRRTVEARSFWGAIALVNQVAEHAERLDHHPDIAIAYRKVSFGLETHDVGGLSALDLELARRIDALVV